MYWYCLLCTYIPYIWGNTNISGWDFLINQHKVLITKKKNNWVFTENETTCVTINWKNWLHWWWSNRFWRPTWSKNIDSGRSRAVAWPHAVFGLVSLELEDLPVYQDWLVLMVTSLLLVGSVVNVVTSTVVVATVNENVYETEVVLLDSSVQVTNMPGTYSNLGGWPWGH